MKQSSTPPNFKQLMKAYGIMLYAVAFYPLLIALFFWLYFKGAHWLWGAIVILAMLIFDPIWGILWRGLFKNRRK